MITNTMLLGHPLNAMVLDCALIKTTKRITFEIHFQARSITNEDEAGIIQYKASNGYEIISEHRMDIQSRRIWLKGAACDAPAVRSGTMALPTQTMCDEDFPKFIDALKEWATVKGYCVRLTTVVPPTYLN